MSEIVSSPKTAVPRWQPSEDWLATFIGLAIVLIIAAGLLGPGPQSVTINAEPGETKSASGLPGSRWRVSAALGGERADVLNSTPALVLDVYRVITCTDGVLQAQNANEPPEGVDVPPSGRVQITLINTCDQPVSLSYRTDAAIPWPLFNLFAR